jgi:Ca2+-binding EF-hand superfamily protein
MLNLLQTRNLTTMFRIFDATGNNAVSWSDYETLLRRFGERVGLPSDSREMAELRERFLRDWQELRSLADTTHDGKVGLQEWLQYHDRALGTEEGYKIAVSSVAELMIALADDDGDGVISQENYRGLLGAFGLGGSRADEAFAKLDRNASGRISSDELMKAVDEFVGSDDPSAAGHWLWGDPQGTA